MSFLCATCGEKHEGDPWNFAADFPDMYARMSPDEREIRSLIGSDQCIIDSEIFCIRGCLDIPIIGSDDVFCWGLWARVNELAYDAIDANWLRVGKEKILGPFSGRLVNSLSVYSVDTFNLKVTVQIRPVGERPVFIVDVADHPLAIEQR